MSEVLESLPSLPNGLEHDLLQNEGGMTMLQDIIEKTVNALEKTTGSEREHKHPQYREIGPREVPTVLQRRRDTLTQVSHGMGIKTICGDRKGQHTIGTSGYGQAHHCLQAI